MKPAPGAAQWLLMIALLVVWRGTSGRLALGLAVIGLSLYALAGWMLPALLLDYPSASVPSVTRRCSQICRE